MVKKVQKSSLAGSGDLGPVINENGKRLTECTDNEAKKRVKTKSLYKQPTVRELTRLNETEALFNSNLFRLQIEEILQEVKVKEKTEKKFQEWFVTFKKRLEIIPENGNEFDLTENTLFKKLKVKSPISASLKKTKCTFKFFKFKEIKIVGSYSLGCSIDSKLVIDTEITVPAETYTKNDSINYRYHNKRAAYLACIAAHLKNTETIEDLKYSWLNGSESKPVLDFKPSGKLGKHLSIRLHLACEDEAYKLQRFSPSRNNLREAWLFDLENAENNTEIGPPTSYYNCSVLGELTSSVNQEFLTNTFHDNDNLKQAVILLKIWLRQRRLDVSGHIISLFVAYLVQLKRINNIMSSYQIVRNIWIALKQSEWDTKGISVHKGDSTPPLDEFLEHFPVVFLDVTGYHNICYQMQRGTYQALRRESGLAVEMLDDATINSFVPLFMTPINDLEMFDNVLRFNNVEAAVSSIYTPCTKESKLNYGIEKLQLATDAVYRELMRGLGDRVQLILPRVDNQFSCSVDQCPEKAKEERARARRLSFGLILEPEQSLNVVLKGPPANLPEAEEFRSFWGDKSELRRFQDGGITEACVWRADTLAERRLITKQIVLYLLKLKYGIESGTTYIAEQLESAITRKQLEPGEDAGGTGEEACLRVIHAFDELRKDLRSLKDLPLDINSVYGTSPVLSYCTPLPRAHAAPPRAPWRRGNTTLIKDSAKGDKVTCPEYVPVCEAVLELGHSGKWPGELQAFRCLKAAFHLQISEQLSKQCSIPSQPYYTHVDVMKNGVVFRLRVAHSKELTLLRREVQNGVVKYRETEESVALFKNTILLPKLRSALHGLHLKHPSLGGACCLLQRWLCCHLLDAAHFPPEAAQLLSAWVFVQPAPYSAPSSPRAGFARALRLLATRDWATEMLLIDFNADLTAEQKSEIERKFSTRDPETALYIVTSYDEQFDSVWTKHSPSKRMLARVRALANVSLQALESNVDNALNIFIPSLSGYDVLIRLRSSLVPFARERLDARPALARVLADEHCDVIPVVEFSAVQKYLDELRSAFGEFALFFHDSFGGDVVAVLWRPRLHQLTDLQVATASGMKPVQAENETKYQINKDALIDDFKIMGRGLVTEVTVNS